MRVIRAPQKSVFPQMQPLGLSIMVLTETPLGSGTEGIVWKWNYWIFNAEILLFPLQWHPCSPAFCTASRGCHGLDLLQLWLGWMEGSHQGCLPSKWIPEELRAEILSWELLPPVFLWAAKEHPRKWSSPAPNSQLCFLPCQGKEAPFQHEIQCIPVSSKR